MYKDTITLFVRKDKKWQPIILKNVDLNTDRGRIVSTYGEKCTDRAMLHVAYTEKENKTYIDKLIYVPQEDYTGDWITFQTGEDFSFFISGEWEGTDEIDDEDYIDGFYNHLSSRKPAYKINSIAKYSVIPHFEVLGR